ncbi:helix-hairpin-helix domain-containing protein [Pseudomonas sp. UL073]|uniref:Helix-hairpin-helix domain-containing protein n=1 Tax=Zestomonas insulae TaxID=2809017 RepID=A0ABS2ICL3_9GAMM|nr:helix-hairpin-helix domain-containing protein [Pseudomonas insulae]MBM7060849.1 helix-hairpin-helix domain-containing protein [Pseudomonas insulae]
MLKAHVSSLLFAVLATVSVAVNAAETTKPQASKPVAAAAKPAKEAAAPAVEDAVNLNTADADTLQKELSGIGAVKAKAIVDYREANGPFATVDELLEVKGIGAATLEKNRAKLSIN